jgi:hypothetical protein
MYCTALELNKTTPYTAICSAADAVPAVADGVRRELACSP